MKKISAYIWERKFILAFAILSMIISIGLDMLSPQLSKYIVDDVIINREVEKLTPLLLCILGVGLGRCIFQYAKEFTFDCVGSKISCEIRRDLFTHIQSLSADFFDRTGTGELMSRLKDDVDRIWDALSFVGMLMIEVCIHTVFVLLCMYRLNWKLAIFLRLEWQLPR